KLENAALRSESVDLDGSEIHLQGVQEVAGLLKLLGPLDKLSHPRDALVVVGPGARLAGFVLPVSGDAFLGEAVHVLGADLDFKGLAAVQDGGVQRLVEIGAGKGEIVLEAAGNGPPDVMDDAESGVAVALAVGNNANREEIVDLIQTALLAGDF